jgi:hypothetical protein
MKENHNRVAETLQKLEHTVGIHGLPTKRVADAVASFTGSSALAPVPGKVFDEVMHELAQLRKVLPPPSPLLATHTETACNAHRDCLQRTPRLLVTHTETACNAHRDCLQRTPRLLATYTDTACNAHRYCLQRTPILLATHTETSQRASRSMVDGEASGPCDPRRAGLTRSGAGAVQRAAEVDG